jgi:putative nucleotidyltransferase with HDIG domain
MDPKFGTRRGDRHGSGVYELDIQDKFWTSPAELSNHLRKVVTAPNYQPPLLPAVALELVQLSSDPATPMSKVRALVESEPMIAARVLQLAQSAMYSRGTSVTSLDDAMTRLGLKNLADLFLQAAMTLRVFRAKGYEQPMDELRKHSVACAHLSRLICRRTGFPDEYAYMCGLLHDVGIAAGILVFGEPKRGVAAPRYDEIRPSIEMVHEEASAILAKSWDLPPDVQLVLSNHHRFVIGGRVHPLAAAVCLADWMAGEIGLASGGEANSDEGKRAGKELRLSDQDLKSLLVEANALVTLL